MGCMRDGTGPLAVRVGVPALVGLPALLDQVDEQNTLGAWALCLTAVVLGVAGSVAREQAPVRSFAAVFAVAATTQLTAAAGDVRLSTLVVLPLGFAFYFLGRHAPNQASCLSVATAIVLMMGGLVVNQLTAAPGRAGGLDVVAIVVALPLGWVLGGVLRSREQDLGRSHADRERQAELEQHRIVEARVAERLAIARDMHDVVAHSLTMTTVHAEVLRSRSGELPQWVNERIDGLATTARQANQELHGLLTTLRDHGTAAGTSTVSSAVAAPSPTLDDLDQLAQDAATARQQVGWDLTRPRGLSRLQEAALYRVVQEALSNARRHAPGSPVRVALTCQAGVVVVEVRNGPTADTVPLPEGRQRLGLVGIEERVHALGGKVGHGPTTDGGFVVRASIPVLPSTSRTGATS